MSKRDYSRITRDAIRQVGRRAAKKVVARKLTRIKDGDFDADFEKRDDEFIDKYEAAKRNFSKGVTQVDDDAYNDWADFINNRIPEMLKTINGTVASINKNIEVLNGLLNEYSDLGNGSATYMEASGMAEELPNFVADLKNAMKVLADYTGNAGSDLGNALSVVTGLYYRWPV